MDYTQLMTRGLGIKNNGIKYKQVLHNFMFTSSCLLDTLSCLHNNEWVNPENSQCPIHSCEDLSLLNLISKTSMIKIFGTNWSFSLSAVALQIKNNL